MLADRPTVRGVIGAIQKLDSGEQKQILHVLPFADFLKPEDRGWLRAAQSSFGFWDNEEDAIYDRL